MEKKIIKFTGIVWGFLFLIGFLTKHPALGFMPLCGFYPGGIAPGGRGYNPHYMLIWGILFGFIYVALGFVALRSGNVSAAYGFLALFLLSGFVFAIRGMAVLSQLH